MSVNQQTGYPAISLPQGASSLPDQLIPCLSQFQKVVIWLDNDAAGHLAEDKISFKIGVARAYVIRNDDPQLKDANDYLRNAP